ncbi:hypothetical protein BDV96DRAFT_486572 [Lophiotrema nucula]|uniref:DNA repair protein Dds20/Mei5 n=1 Tax=Lophiotrema nucula TaxID=690887 RepID=A0A6A5ZIM4_9PLEO|nr:hypothetical protein BDV96DRAFT_486572 [Lophiotrema nucula]
MATPQAKRRRLNDAAKTLHKPFKSPFRTPLKHDSGADTGSSDPVESTPTSLVSDSSALSEAAPANDAKSSTASTPAITSKPRNSLATPSRAAAKKPSPSITREIVQLRSDIQILSQAHALVTTTEDADLEILIGRWRTASRAAAEELFAGTRDRVNRMGGVAAWRDREKQQREWRQKMDQEEMEAQQNRAGDEDDEDGQRKDTVGREEYERYETYDGVEKEAAEKEEEPGSADDDSFTMDMMLKTLNIDLKLIGYEKEAQRWEG